MSDSHPAPVGCSAPPARATPNTWTECQPRLLRDVVVVPLETGVLIDGLAQDEIIEGAFAQTVLPHLLRLLDGKNSVKQIAEDLPDIALSDIRSAIDMLHEWGLIEHWNSQNHLNNKHHTAGFLRRQIGRLRLDASLDDAWKRLNDARVVLLCSEATLRTGEGLLEILRVTGIANALVQKRDCWEDADRSGATLVVDIVADSNGATTTPDLIALTTHRKCPLLRVALASRRGIADLGPLFGPGRNDECIECFRHVHVLPSEECSWVLENDAFHDDIWLGFVATEIVNTVALPMLALQSQQFRRFSTDTWESRLLNYPHLPQCPRCRCQRTSPELRGATIPEPTDPLATDTFLVYDEYMAIASETGLASDATENSKDLNNALAKEAKVFPNCPKFQLFHGKLEIEADTLSVLRSAQSIVAGQVTVRQLAVMAALTVGIREISNSFVRRWSSTAGNLGSVDLLLVNRCSNELAPGFYFYQARSHTLAQLRKRASIEVCEFMSRTLCRSYDCLPGAMILLTGSFFKLSRKYGPFAFKLMHLDAGVAASQLMMLARALKLDAHLVQYQADDLICKQFNLAPFQEYPTVSIEFPSPGQTTHHQIFKDNGRESSYSLNGRPLKRGDYFANLNAEDVTSILLDESQLLEGQPHRVQPIDQCCGRESSLISCVLNFPSSAPNGRSVGEVLGTRRTVREFAPISVPAVAIGTALDVASSVESAEFAEGRIGQSRLSFAIIAKRVEGVPSGVYLYEPDCHGLCKVGALTPDESLSSVFVQSDLFTVPVVILIMAELSSSCAQQGAWGYRQLVTRAGMAGHRIMMSSLAQDLSAALIAGLRSHTIRGLLSDRYSNMSTLLGVAIGYPR